MHYQTKVVNLTCDQLEFVQTRAAIGWSMNGKPIRYGQEGFATVLMTNDLVINITQLLTEKNDITKLKFVCFVNQRKSKEIELRIDQKNEILLERIELYLDDFLYLAVLGGLGIIIAVIGISLVIF